MGVNKVVLGTTTIIDISDSTVTAESMIQGTTAYGADGEKITGTIKKNYGGISAEAEPSVGYHNGSQCVQFSYTPEEPSFISPTTGGVYLKSPFENFGDATAEDVAVGKTFTSAAGLKVEGTYAPKLTATDDGAGNVILYFPNASASADADGNVTIV